MAQEALPAAPKPRRIFSRRKFIIGLTAGAVASSEGAVVLDISRFLKNKALETPHISHSFQTPDYNLLYPGSIHDQSKATVLLDPKSKGFVPMLTAEAEIPLVSQVAKETYDFSLKYKKATGNRATLGMLLVHGLEFTEEKIKSPAYKLAAGTNPKEVAAEYAISGVTIFATPWLDLTTYKKVGLLESDTSPKSLSKLWWGENGDGIGWNLYPRLFGEQKPATPDTPGIEPAYRGIERFMHSATNAYLAFRYETLKTSEHPLVDTIPYALKLAINLAKRADSIKTPADEALLFCFLAGIGHEIQGTLSSETIHDLKKGLRPRYGLLDPRVGRDIAANIHGAGAGLYFLHTAKHRLSTQRFEKLVDDPKFKNEGTSPVLQPIR